MKITLLLLAACVVVPASGQTVAYTLPSGYVKHDLQTGFNYLGLTVHKPILASGTLGTPSGTTLPSGVADLTTALGTADANSLVIIEITGGDNEGATIEASSWSGADFTNIASLGDYTELDEDTFQVRSACSISDLFGSDNSAGFAEGTLQTADVVWVAAGGGSYSKFYYSPGDPGAFPAPIAEGWKTSVGADATNTKVNYLDGLFIQRRGAAIQVTFFGEVKKQKTNLAIEGSGFNFFGAVYPASTTLSDSNLDAFITHGTLVSGDVIWMPDGASSWKKYYYALADPGAFPAPVTAGWKTSVGADASNVEITAGMIVQRRSATPLNALYEPHSLYDTL